MTRKLTVLDRVRVASPCQEPWAAMTGDSRVRRCDRCNLNVFNLSEMSGTEAEALISEREGRLCVRYFQRADGTILTSDCPIGVSIVRRKVARVLAGVAAAFAFVAGGLHALGRTDRDREELRLRYLKPFDHIITWIAPQPRQIVGSMVFE